MNKNLRRVSAALLGALVIGVVVVEGTQPASAITTPPSLTPSLNPSVTPLTPSVTPVARPTPTPVAAPALPDMSAARGSSVVYLTFDDGPGKYTPQVLSLLAAYDAKATFFVIGAQAAADPAGVRAIKAAGHTVANHTWSHPNLRELSAPAIRTQISRTDAALGFTTRCVRPPYGATNSTVATTVSSMGKRSVLWSVDPQDWARPGASTIADRVLSTVRPGATVLMHDGGGDRSQTVTALATVLETLKARGYAFRAVPGC